MKSWLWKSLFWTRDHAFTLALSFLTSGGITMLMFAHRLSKNRDILVSLGAEFIGGAIFTLVLKAVQSTPRITKGIDYQALSHTFATARYRIRILTTFSYLFCPDSSIPDSIDRVALSRARLALQLKARTDTISIEVLIIDPTSAGATARARDRPQEHIVTRIQENIGELQRWAARYGPEAGGLSKFQVKLYDSIPRISLLQWDETASISFFEKSLPISKSERTQFNMDQPVGVFFCNSFETIWEDPTTVDLTTFVATHPELKLAEGV